MKYNFPKTIKSDLELLPWLGKTHKMLSIFMKVVFEKNGFNMTREQFILLAVLHDHDGMMQKDLAFITERNKGSLARLVSTAEKKNLVARIPSKEDKRVNRIYLTKLGIRTYEKLKPVLIQSEKQVLKGLSKNEIEVTASVLKKIQKNISNQ